jgi:adenosine kinase
MGGFKIACRGPQNHCPSLSDIDAALHGNYGIHLAG